MLRFTGALVALGALLGAIALLSATQSVLADGHDSGVLAVETPQPLPGLSAPPVGDGPWDLAPQSIAPAQAAAPLDVETSIEGINFDEDASNTGFFHIPPDPIGAVGPDHLVSVVNTSIEWHTKAGIQQNGQSLVGFFSGLGPATVFDPKVIYDQFAGRFLVVALEQDDNTLTSRILLAVSDDSDPNDTWHQIAINSVVPIDGVLHWADYPGFAIDEEAVYVTVNMYRFGLGTFGGTRLWIIAKSGFYSGGTAVATVHDPQGAEGVVASTMQPAHMLGAAPTGVGTFLARYSGASIGGNEYLSIIRVDDPLGSPIFTNQFVSAGNIDNISVGMPDASQLGSSELIETNDRRALHAVWRDSSLWITTHVVPPSGSDAGQATAHWFQVDTSNLASLALTDQGDVGGNDVDAGAFTYFPSIAVDSAGGVGIGFSLSSPNHYPGAYYTGRLATDAAGTVRDTKALATGQGPYLRTFLSGRNRWGDYSGISIDPTSDATFWVFNQYALTPGTVFYGEDGRWGTRWGSFSLGADLAVTKSDSPDPATEAQALTYTLALINNGPFDTTGATLTDTLPSGVAFVSATSTQGSCSESGGTVTCNLGSLADAASATVTITVTPSVVGSLTNTASVTSAIADPDSSNNSVSVSTTVVAPVPVFSAWVMVATAVLFGASVLFSLRRRTMRQAS